MVGSQTLLHGAALGAVDKLFYVLSYLSRVSYNADVVV